MLLRQVSLFLIVLQVDEQDLTLAELSAAVFEAQAALKDMQSQASPFFILPYFKHEIQHDLK